MNFIIAVHAESMIAKMDGAPAAMRRSLKTALDKLSIQVQSSVKSDKLSGQVLHVRTGTLRRSINREVTERADGIFAIVGTNLEYAHIHEYGGTILMLPRARLTYFKMNKDGTVSNKFVKKSEAGFVMRHEARSVGTYVTMPERSFLRSTLKDFEPRFKQDIRAAVMEVLR